MKNVRRAALVIVFTVFAAACGGGDGTDETTRDANGNVIEAGTIDVFSLQVGDCFMALPSGVSTVDAVPCAQDHLYEVFHQFDVNLDEFDSGAVDTAASTGCSTAFEPYTGVAEDTSYYAIAPLQPSAGSWSTGDREVLCLLTPVNGATTTGTARGAGLVREQALAATTTTTAPPVVEETTTTEAPVIEETTTTTTAPEDVGGSQSVFELSVGECFVTLPEGSVSEIERVSCDEPHGLEVYHLFDIDLPDYDEEGVDQAALDGCLGAFEAYVGVAYEVSFYGIDWLQPSPGSWGGGDREVVCMVFPFDEDVTESVGSARGSGR